jgi:acetyltransferase
LPFDIVAVNKMAAEPTMLGVPVYRQVTDIPEGLCDLAVVMTPAAIVRGVVEECGKKGIKGAIVISAGFKEQVPLAKRWETTSSRPRKHTACASLGPTLSVGDSLSVDCNILKGRDIE